MGGSTCWFFLLVWLCFARVEGGKVWVKEGAAVGGDGSEEFPFGDFQSAFGAAQDGDEIIAEPGVYPAEKNVGMEMGNNLTSISFSSSSDTQLVQIDSHTNHEGIPFLRSNITDYFISISKFKFFGQSQGNVIEIFGKGKLEVNICEFSENKFEGKGHCLFVSGNAEIIVKDSTFFYNTGSENGPVIYLENTNNNNPTTKQSQQNSNKTKATITDSEFRNNGVNTDITDTTEWVSGGAIFIGDNVYFLARYCTFHENAATEQGGQGGAVCGDGTNSQIRLQYCSFDQNSAKKGGAVSFTGNSMIQLWDSNFTNNLASEGLDVFLSQSSSPLLSNNLFVPALPTAFLYAEDISASSPLSLSNLTVQNNSDNQGESYVFMKRITAYYNCDLAISINMENSTLLTKKCGAENPATIQNLYINQGIFQVEADFVVDNLYWRGGSIQTYNDNSHANFTVNNEFFVGDENCVFSEPENQAESVRLNWFVGTFTVCSENKINFDGGEVTAQALELQEKAQIRSQQSLSIYIQETAEVRNGTEITADLYLNSGTKMTLDCGDLEYMCGNDVPIVLIKGKVSVKNNVDLLVLSLIHEAGNTIQLLGWESYSGKFAKNTFQAENHNAPSSLIYKKTFLNMKLARNHFWFWFVTLIAIVIVVVVVVFSVYWYKNKQEETTSIEGEFGEEPFEL